jgi:glucans biosynthesis protein
MVDFTGGRLADLNPEAPVTPAITLSAGIVKALVARPNTVTGGWRVSFILETGGAKLCDLRCTLKLGDELLSEVWSYRWTL